MKTTKIKSEYDIQAEAFAINHNTTMAALYLGHFPRFGEYATSQWQITLTRQGCKPFVFTFSQSINESWAFKKGFKRVENGLPSGLSPKGFVSIGKVFTWGDCQVRPTKHAPSLYDVLACLTKSNPSHFEEFCEEYDYSDDLISARDTWQAVVKEWREVERLFGDCLDELQEIN